MVDFKHLDELSYGKFIKKLKDGTKVAMWYGRVNISDDAYPLGYFVKRVIETTDFNEIREYAKVNNLILRDFDAVMVDLRAKKERGEGLFTKLWNE